MILHNCTNSCLFFMTFLLFTITVMAQQDTVKYFGKEYLPLRDNMMYIYDSSLGEAEMEVSLEDSVYKVTYSASGMEYSQNLHYAQDTVYLTRTENEVLFWGTTFTYSSPAVRLPFPLYKGKSWEWKGRQSTGDYEGEVTIAGKVTGEEKITTEAGTFDCVRIEMEIITPRKTDRTIEWLAKDTGIVRYEAHLSSSGFTGAIQDLLGLDKIEFVLKEVE